MTSGSALRRATDSVRAWAWSPSPRVSSLESRLFQLTCAATERLDQGAWSSARPLAALAEASQRLPGRERLVLADTARDLAATAPTAQERSRCVRAELRYLGALVVASTTFSSGPSADSAEGYVDPVVVGVRARIQRILATGEHADGAPVTATADWQSRFEARLAGLCVGEVLPRFLARDTAGNEVRSTLLRGKITVLRFWDPSSRASMHAHEQDAALARRFWDQPVAFYGATKGSDRAAYLKELDSREFGGTQLFDGPISTALSDELARAGHALAHGAGLHSEVSLSEAWSRPEAGSFFIIDENGVIRGRDLEQVEAAALVSRLVGERRTRLRSQFGGRLTSVTDH